MTTHRMLAFAAALVACSAVIGHALAQSASASIRTAPLQYTGTVGTAAAAAAPTASTLRTPRLEYTGVAGLR